MQFLEKKKEEKKKHQTKTSSRFMWVPNLQLSENGCFQKIGIPQNGWWKLWKTLLKWMIWENPPYFWKHPNVSNFGTPKCPPCHWSKGAKRMSWWDRNNFRCNLGRNLRLKTSKSMCQGLKGELVWNHRMVNIWLIYGCCNIRLIFG